MIFTSGTTARPKAVMLTHANLLWAGERSVRDFLLRPDDRLLTALPLFHGNAQALALLPALTVGVPARDAGGVPREPVLVAGPRAPRDPHRPRRDAAAHAHGAAAVAVGPRSLPARRELRHQRPRRREGRLRGALRRDADATATACRRRMLASRTCPSTGPSAGRRSGCRTPTGASGSSTTTGVEVATGEVGEITVHGVPGRTLMKGYYKDPEATAAALRDGWLHTGDHGWVDELGYLYFFDRKKDVIKRAGENVSAMEVETVLLEHPEIELAAVVARPRSDPRRGREGVRRAPPRQRAARRGHHGVLLGAPRPLQGADDRRAARRVAAHVGRQGGEEGAACLASPRSIPAAGARGHPGARSAGAPPRLRPLRARVRRGGPRRRRAADVPALDHRVGGGAAARRAARGRHRRRARRSSPSTGCASWAAGSSSSWARTSSTRRSSPHARRSRARR